MCHEQNGVQAREMAMVTEPNKLNLSLITELNESRQYRSKSAFLQTDARVVCDHAFMDLIAIWILFNEFEFNPLAQEYANRTVAFNRFSNYRQMGTDLYLNLHVITENRSDLLGSKSDIALLGRVQLDTQQLVRYLRSASNNNMSTSLTRQTLQRVENALYIENSNYRSVRRLAQSWPTLQTGQKRAVLTRMMFFYQMNARRSEMYGAIQSLAKNKNLVDTGATNPEMSVAAKIAAGAAAVTVGYAAGYRLGKSL